MMAEVSDRDVWAVERLAEAAMRAGHTQESIQGFALALRLRAALDLWEETEREETERCPVT